MWLFIDTHEPRTFRAGWLSADGTTDVARGEGRPHRVLAHVAKAWVKRPGPRDGICVVAGPGSYSSIRTGVLHANLLSRLSGLPLAGVTVDEAADLSALARALADGRVKPSSYVAPVYAHEPNITTHDPQTLR